MIYALRFKLREPSGLSSFKDKSFYLSIETNIEVNIIIKALSSNDESADHAAAQTKPKSPEKQRTTTRAFREKTQVMVQKAVNIDKNL